MLTISELYKCLLASESFAIMFHFSQRYAERNNHTRISSTCHGATVTCLAMHYSFVSKCETETVLLSETVWLLCRDWWIFWCDWLRDWCVLWFIYVVRCSLCICLLWCFEGWSGLIVMLQTWKWTGLWCSQDWPSLDSSSSSSFSWPLHISFASCTLLHCSYILFLFSFLAVAYIIRKLYTLALFMYRLPLLFPGAAYTTSVTSCRFF